MEISKFPVVFWLLLELICQIPYYSLLFFHPINISSSATLCSPRTKPLYGKFLLQRWADARKELGLDDPFVLIEKDDITMLQYMQRVDFVVNTVNSHTVGAKVFYNDDIPVPYIPIAMCAEETILINLDEMTAPTRSKIPESKRPFQHHLKVIKTQSQLELLLSAACVTPDYQSAIREEPRLYNSNDNTTYSCSSVRTFTFVMEPFKRFAKSYSEALWRFHFSKDRRNSDGSVKKINSTLVKEHIRDIFSFRIPKVASAQILFPLAGSLFAFHVDIVGHIDNFPVDWQTLVAPQYGFTAKEFKYLNGHTESEPNPDYLKKRQNNDFDKIFQLDRGETDKTHARKALKQLATSEPNYMRALCHMLLIDYICLPMYPLPPPCSFLQSLRDKAVQAMEVNSEVPPHI